MPLSEHEQRLLDQIERGLYAEDPKFAQTVQATNPRKLYKRRMAQAAIGFVAGVCLLMAGVISTRISVGVGGFVVMLACCVWGLTSWKRMAGVGVEKPAPPADRPSKRSARPSRPKRAQRSERQSRGKFMERMEERWRRRRE